MEETTEEMYEYSRINSEAALRNLKMESPNTYRVVLRLREEHSCLMKLPVKRIIPLMARTIEGLIADGICKRKKSDEYIELLNTSNYEQSSSKNRPVTANAPAADEQRCCNEET